jgi:hypothetical protein
MMEFHILSITSDLLCHFLLQYNLVCFVISRPWRPVQADRGHATAGPGGVSRDLSGAHLSSGRHGGHPQPLHTTAGWIVRKPYSSWVLHSSPIPGVNLNCISLISQVLSLIPSSDKNIRGEEPQIVCSDMLWKGDKVGGREESRKYYLDSLLFSPDPSTRGALHVHYHQPHTSFWVPKIRKIILL